MKPVGIIANPASGKDIRRLVAYGSVFDNNEKVNIVRRVILGLDSLGVPTVYFMPDFFGIGVRAMDGLDVSLEVSFLQMEPEGTQDDSTRAAGLMNELGVACIITLGGDGTNRAVAKTCRNTPILPISTGTNNVFPAVVEGTLAGIAAGVTALNSASDPAFVKRVPRLEIRRDGQLVDMALVDVVVSEAGFIASRALWDISKIKEIFLARAEPENIGFSSIGGILCGLTPDSGKGVHIVIGEGNRKIKAPIAPGLIRTVPIKQFRVFEPEEEILISQTPAMIAVDGERELVVKQGDRLSVALNLEGPRVVDIALALRQASDRGLFLEPQ